MKNAILKSLEFLRSAALTVWLTGLFAVSYLTVAVWSREAFAKFITYLGSSHLFRALYLLFFVNVALRIFGRIARSRPPRLRLCLQLPLMLGFLVFLASLFLSLNMRKKVWLPPLGLGDVITVPWSGERYLIRSVEPALKRKALRTEGSAIFDYEPGVTLLDEQNAIHVVGAFPPRRVGSSYLHVLNFGIGPGVELKKGSDVVSGGFVALRLTPFGSVDTFVLPRASYTFYLSIIPDNTVKKGRETALHYDLEKPKYRVAVVKGDAVIAQAETDSSLSFDGEYTLKFSTPSDWVVLELAYDPFLSVFVFSVFLMALGCFAFPLSFLIKVRPQGGNEK